MQMVTGVTVMGAVVVHVDVHLPPWAGVRINALEKFQERLVPATSVAVPDDFPGRHVQGGKERGLPCRM